MIGQNETKEEQIGRLQRAIEDKRKQIMQLRREQEGELIEDRELRDSEGNAVRLSELFEDSNELLIIHNMGKACAYCTMWADGFNGLAGHIKNRVPMVLITPDEPETQKNFAQSRDWKFRMISASGTDFIRIMGFQNENGHYYPGASALIKQDDGTIMRVGKDFFGPGDFYNAAWHLFDLFPNGSANWSPKYKY